jgi:phage terminase large subunit-like protein
MPTAISRKRVSKEMRAITRGIPGYNPWDAPKHFWFDEVKAYGALQFFEDHLHHVKGPLAGAPFVLEPWEKSIVANIFGWRDSSNHDLRRYREIFILVPRKNGKTSLSAGIILFVITCDGEPGAEIYSSANDRDQARLIFSPVKQMILKSSALEARLKPYQHSIVKIDPETGLETGSSYKPISSDANTKHGFNSHLIINDELHGQRDRELIDVLQTSTGSRLQPLIIHITTSDYDRPSICNEKQDYAENVRSGTFKDYAFLPVIYKAELKDDWTDPEIWAKANPNLGVSISYEYLQRECKRAQQSPVYTNTFRRLHLNVRTELAERWLVMESWDNDKADLFDPADLAGAECWGGLDLSSTQDITAFGLVFPPEQWDKGPWKFLCWLWCPADRIEYREKVDRVPYATWSRAGHITPTAGDQVDYSFVRKRIVELNRKYSVQDIGFDPYNATYLCQQLRDQDGLNMVEFRQGAKSYNEPMKYTLGLVESGRLLHNNNPVLRWMAGNIAAEMDSNDNLRPNKKKSAEKIDGIITLLESVGRALAAQQQRSSVYDSRGLLRL